MRFTAPLLYAALAVSAAPAGAQSFPTRQITLVVPFAAGGSNDVIARVIGARLPELGLVGDHAPNALPQIRAPLQKLRCGAEVVAPARPRQRDGQHFFDSSRPRTHQHDPIGQEQCLVEAVGDENDGLAGGRDLHASR